MKRLGRVEDGHLLTTGEKALVAMLVAGMFGYWAGFNLSAPGVADPFPIVSASATQPAASMPAATKAADRADAEIAPSDDPPAPSF
jgi:hypothetical protein